MVDGFNIKSIPLQALPDEAWVYLTGQPSGRGELTPLHLYQRQAWVYRSTDIRAKAVASMPMTLWQGKTDVSESEAHERLLKQIRKNLYRTEAALCLNGASYLLRETNRWGLNFQLRWALPRTIKPAIDKKKGLTGFGRQLPGESQPRPLSLKDVIYTWMPCLDAEIGPGEGPALAAMGGGSTLYRMDQFVEGFFDRGAIRATLLIVDGNPQPGEMKKLESWWKRMLTGVRNAYETVAMKSNVKPVVIGDGLKEATNPKLVMQAREDVLTAMGVPHSLAISNASNFATANQDVLNLYDQTVIPQVELILEALNEQLLEPQGLRLEANPKKLEVYQKYQLTTAETLRGLTGDKPIMTVNEAREWLDMEPLPEPEQPHLAPVVQQPEETQQPAEQPKPAKQDAADQELKAWERKALRRLKERKSAAVDFDSAHISPDQADAISDRLSLAESAEDVRQAFKAVQLSDAEQALVEQLVKALQAGQSAAVKAILAGAEDVDLSTLESALRAILLPALVEEVLASASLIAIETGPDFDLAQLQLAALEWASTYTFELVKGISDTTKALLQKAISVFRATPGMTREALERLLRPAFGEARAEMIAITEVTRAAAQGVRRYQDVLAEQGLEMERVWRTNADEGVCSLCSPLNGKVVDDATMPPAHVRCRCAITLRRKKR